MPTGGPGGSSGVTKSDFKNGLKTVKEELQTDFTNALNDTCNKIGRDFESLEDKLDTFMESLRKEHLDLKEDMNVLQADMKAVLRQLDVKEKRLDNLEGVSGT